MAARIGSVEFALASKSERSAPETLCITHVIGGTSAYSDFSRTKPCCADLVVIQAMCSPWLPMIRLPEAIALRGRVFFVATFLPS